MILYDFHESHKTIMKLSPESALEFLLNHSHPKELVQSFSEEHFYFFITSIGIKEAGPIIALASEKQWEYFLDVEIWEKDLLDYFSLTNLFMLMINTDAERFVRWCFNEKRDFIKLYFFRNINIKMLDNDEDYFGLDENYFTNDGVFYISIINYNTSYEDELNFLEKRNIMIKAILSRFSNIDYARYQNLLIETINTIPSELEEELFRIRNVRLAEKGFLPFHEAIAIYQPIKLKNIKKKVNKILKTNKYDHRDQLIPYFPNDIFRKKNLFSSALKSIHDKVILQKLKIELGSLCNIIISADNKKIRSYHDLKTIVEKTNDFLNIGLQFILYNNENTKQKTLLPRDIIKNWYFNDIFRLGYSQILKLNQKVKNWYDKSWFTSQNLKLHFWGEYWFGILGGLLLNQPMFFKTVDLSYRNFREYNEVCAIGKTVDQIILIDNMLSQFNSESFILNSKYFINVNNLLLTMWFLNTFNIKKENLDFYPIPLIKFQLFYNQIWERRNGKKQIKKTRKNDLFALLAKKMDLEISKLPEGIVSFINILFKKLEDELSNVALKDINPKYIKLLVIDFG